MAKEQATEGIQEQKQECLEVLRNGITTEAHSKGDASSTINAFKFNVNAPEFVPQSSQPPVPISSYFVPCFHYLRGAGGTDWIYNGGAQDGIFLATNTTAAPSALKPKTILTEELQKEILTQMEYQFNDMSLLTNDNLAKLINKDPNGFVPISAVASSKKIKSLVVTNRQLLSKALRASLKLDVSSDGKKVKRKVPFTKRVKEDLQLRTIVAENLPEDHSLQNIHKIFNVAGTIKTIRVCHPQNPSAHSKGGFIISTKLHALVEFENHDAAKRAVEMLNDQRSWRTGLRVRSLLRRLPKSIQRKKEFNGILDDKRKVAEIQSEALTQVHNPKSIAAVAASASVTTPIDHNNGEENSTASKKVWSIGRGKYSIRTQTSRGQGLLTSTPQIRNLILGEASTRQTIKGPKMPDGTRGFTMGRGRPLSSLTPQS